MVRLMQMRSEAVITDLGEADHLQNCLECRALLRKLAEERSRALLNGDAASKSDNNFGKSA